MYPTFLHNIIMTPYLGYLRHKKRLSQYSLVLLCVLLLESSAGSRLVLGDLSLGRGRAQHAGVAPLDDAPDGVHRRLIKQQLAS